IRALQGVDAGSGTAPAVVELAEAIVDGETELGQADKYTDDSVNALREAVDQGKSVLSSADDPETTQADIDAAADAIRTAIDGLVAVSDPDPEPTDGSDPGPEPTDGTDPAPTDDPGASDSAASGSNGADGDEAGAGSASASGGGSSAGDDGSSLP